MKVGLFGGSFDPIHRGHIEPVKAARAALGLDRVYYLPTACPPHKPEGRLAPAHARYAMVELALLDEEGLLVSPFEMAADRRSYTIDTLRHFRVELPGAELVLLLGGDAFAGLPAWKEWRAIVELATLALLVRPGWEAPALASRLPAEVAGLLGGGRVRVVENPPLDVSASELRALLGRGEDPPAGALPAPVVKYVRKYALYR